MRDQRCSYVVIHEDATVPSGDLRSFAAYLSSVAVAGCEVIVVDDTPSFDRNRRVLRWVGRHAAPLPRHRALNGAVDPLRAAFDVATCEKIIVANARVRHDAATIDALCALLDAHEIVEPQDYCEPLPWWGGIDTARILVHRAVDPLPDHGATLGFRRVAVRGLIDGLVDDHDDPVRRLQAQGAAVHSAPELFVRCEPPRVGTWLRERARQADDDFALPLKTAFFFALLPVAALLIAFGGARLAGGYVGALVVGSLALALRGRAGAAAIFPFRASLFAPLWLLERSMSVYWALLRKLSGVNVERPVERPGMRTSYRDVTSQRR
ncbi:MAG TPA: hypothetical protein VG323_01125 [Thermoanaerobaculia bacterium]|nr:hypothetical protein [Thermoanaerobaculia bacterium]